VKDAVLLVPFGTEPGFKVCNSRTDRLATDNCFRTATSTCPVCRSGWSVPSSVPHDESIGRPKDSLVRTQNPEFTTRLKDHSMGSPRHAAVLQSNISHQAHRPQRRRDDTGGKEAYAKNGPS
jgi:hypothetical protein